MTFFTSEVEGWPEASQSEDLTYQKIQVWRDRYEGKISQDQDELKTILDRIRSSLKSSPTSVVLYSVTPLLFRHSSTRIARFIGEPLA